MPSPEPALPETREPHCPHCRSNQIAPVGHVMAAHGVIKAEHRCAVCRTAFFVVRPAFT
jgi:formate dehydrogenase maturation protein FdhE